MKDEEDEGREGRRRKRRKKRRRMKQKGLGLTREDELEANQIPQGLKFNRAQNNIKANILGPVVEDPFSFFSGLD